MEEQPVPQQLSEIQIQNEVQMIEGILKSRIREADRLKEKYERLQFLMDNPEEHKRLQDYKE